MRKERKRVLETMRDLSYYQEKDDFTIRYVFYIKKCDSNMFNVFIMHYVYCLE